MEGTNSGTSSGIGLRGVLTLRVIFGIGGRSADDDEDEEDGVTGEGAVKEAERDFDLDFLIVLARW